MAGDETEDTLIAEEEKEIAPQWKKLPIADMIEHGWRPRVKKHGRIAYLTLRLGNQERSLGRHSDELLTLLTAKFPKVDWGLHQKPATSTLLSTRLGKPQPLKTQIQVSLEVLSWYEWAQTKGYPHDIGTFISEIVHLFFQDQGLERPVIIRRLEPEVRKELTPIGG